jgi:hypothetical protein
MLPDGFHWQGFHDGYALVLGGKVVASVTPVAAGVRLDINSDLPTRRHEFFATMATGRAYLEAWAVKWEAKIRDEYARRVR